jgi:acetyl esterase/lipase
MKKILGLILISCVMNAHSQEVFPLYASGIPNSKPTPDTEETSVNSDSITVISNISRPTLTAYFPPAGRANGDAIIICPGGGYSIVAAVHEGADVAKRLNGLGITAFVLKYRIPNKQWMQNPEIGPLQDAQRAIQMVRENTTKWNLNKHRVGILGFSAGGHLASTAATHYKKSYIPNKRKINLRPDFLVLIYPVISFTDSIGHIGSRENLLGKNASQEKIKEYSNELHVTKDTPPTFLVHAKDDKGVDYHNTIAFADALNAHGVFSEVFLYEAGGHGFGLINKTSDIDWVDRLDVWLKKVNK